MSPRASLLLAFLAAVPLGCSTRDGPEEYRATGTVTFDGRPVPDGWVCFTPDSAKGNVGPQARARIRNGAYDTDAKDGRGVVGGPMRVRIDSFDGEATGGLPFGKPMLAAYETTVDLPRGPAAQDFEIPKAWGSKKLPALPP